MKKQYTYPKIIISVTEEDKKIAQELRDKHSINVSSLFRNKLREIYKSLNENSKNI
jgi:hypothetical protein